jgi:nicotinamidase-related amidase
MSLQQMRVIMTYQSDRAPVQLPQKQSRNCGHYMKWSLQMSLRSYELPPPSFYDASKVGDIFAPNYGDIIALSAAYRKAHKILPRRLIDRSRLVNLTIIDQQVTFCLKEGELSLAPAGIGDTQRIAEFLFRNGRVITDKTVTLDSHYLWHIFHPIFWLDADGNFVAPYTVITTADIGSKYFVNPEICGIIWRNQLQPMNSLGWLEAYVVEYTKTLAADGKPPLVVWPIHARLGHLGHGLVPTLAAAIDFHDLIIYAETEYLIKGELKLSEYYSPFGTEVLDFIIDGQKHQVGASSDKAVSDLLSYRINILAGEAKSHCVRAGVFDILNKIRAQDPNLAGRVYLLGDCTSNVPGFEKQGEDAFAEFRAAGMHIVDSTTPMQDWPDMPPEIFQLAA